VQAFKENDMGSFDGQMTKTEYEEIDSGDVVIEDTRAKTVTKREGEYLLDATIAANFVRPEYQAGTEVELKVTPNDVQTHSAIIITTVHHNQVNTSGETDGSKSMTKVENTAADEAAAATSGGGGLAVSAVNEERPDGLIKTTVTAELEINQLSAGGKSGELEDVAVVENTSSGPVAVSGGAVNVEVEVVEVPTKGGRLKTKKVTTTKKAKTIVNGVTTKDSAAESEALTISLNDTTVVPAEDGDGTYEDIDVSSNGLGGVNVVKRRTTEKDQTAAGGESTLLETVSVDEHTSGPAVEVPAGTQNVKVDVIEAPTRGGKLRTKKVTSTLKPWSSSPAVVADDGVIKVTQTNLKNQTSAPTASINEEVKLSDNDRGGFNALKLTKALSTSASGNKSVHASSVVDWDISKREIRTPTWNTSTNSDADAYITGYNNWLVSMSRSRVITTFIKKTYSLTEPTLLTVTVATPGAGEGEGTSYSKDARKEGDAWVTIEKSVGTGAWGPWGRKTLTWINYIQTTVGSGS
jgi:hypothetical protein